jgi:hypothetical protein
MKWIQENFKKIIYVSFLIPIFLVALVSISHVTKWYGISNPLSWAIYLSIGIEIAALSALAAISAKMGKKVYFPFGIVTLVQFIGNIFFAYQYIDINSDVFKNWVDLVSPLVSYLGVEPDDPIGHKRFLSFFAGGMLPLISLSFLHMLVKFEESDKTHPQVKPIVDIDEISKKAGRIEKEETISPYIPTEQDLQQLETILNLKTTTKEPENTESVDEEIKDDLVVDEPEIEETPVVEVETEKINKEENNIKRLTYVNRNG